MESQSNYSLSRQEIRLFLRPANSHQDRQRWFDLRVSTIGLIGAALLYATALIPALLRYDGGRYWQPILPVLVQDSALADSTDTPVKQTNQTTTDNQTQGFDLQYSALNIEVPVVWDVTYQEKEIQTKLQNGVVHLQGTARPGEQGTIIIVGHSSNFLWAKGSYKTVFAPLLKSNLEDKITLKYSNRLYTYEVNQVYEVEPSRVDLLNAKSDVDLRLVTCTPLGSARKRLIVEAKQISPDRNQNSPFTGTPIAASEIVATR